MPQMPESLVEHQPKYHKDAWKGYTVAELGAAVAFFLKRSGHRYSVEKVRKDIQDAQNYLDMIQAHVDEAKQRIGDA